MDVSPAASEGVELSSAQEQTLLRLARDAINAAAFGFHLDPNLVVESDPVLTHPRAVFVTLRLAADLPVASSDEGGVGPLRGCIGQIEATQPLARAVVEAATRAATIDPRFPPVRPEGLDDIAIEISILSSFHYVNSYEDIQIGRDGLLIVRGRTHRGLLLPQVATMFGFDALQFVAGTCRKAGLPEDAWPGAAELYAFTATRIAEPRFGEESHGAC